MEIQIKITKDVLKHIEKLKKLGKVFQKLIAGEGKGDDKALDDLVKLAEQVDAKQQDNDIDND